MNKLQRIEEMDKQLAALRAEVEQESKGEKWRPSKGGFHILASGNVIDNESGVSNLGTREFGHVRATRESAERARDKMRVFNRLLAYVDEFAPKCEFIFRVKNYFVYFDYVDQSYNYSFHDMHKQVGVVYMLESVAKELCRKLNSGEVVL